MNRCGRSARTSGYGEDMLHRHSEAVLGPRPAGRETRILVTLSKRAAEDPAHVENLVLTGMNCARINCAHDDADVWAAMIANVRAAAHAHGRTCLVLMDLAGPKIRTRNVVTPPDRKTVAAGDRIFLTFGKPDGERGIRLSDELHDAVGDDPSDGRRSGVDQGRPDPGRDRRGARRRPGHARRPDAAGRTALAEGERHQLSRHGAAPLAADAGRS